MKILHVITSLNTGGAEHLMVDLLPQLKSHGHEIALFVFDGTTTPFMSLLKQKGISIISSQIGGSVYDPRHILRLRKCLKKFDIIHTHNTSPQLYGAIAVLGMGKILITTEHSTNNRRRAHHIFRPIDQWMYSRYNRIICISKPCEQNLRAYLHSTSDRICTINNGIDTLRFFTAPESGKYNHLTIGQNLIINVAGFRWEKDQPTIIKAVAMLPNDYHLLLVGGGEQSRIEECKKLAKQLEVSNRIHFLGVRTDVPELLKASDIIVMSSHFEGLSLSNLEGMAAGKPFIASDVDGLREIVKGYGILFPHEDALTLAKQIKELCENKAYAKEVAARCQSRALQFDIKDMVKEYDKIYNSTPMVL